MIPKEHRDEYADSYDKAILPIWNPEEIWKEGWHKELIYLGLLTPEMVKKKPKLKS